MWSLHTLQSSPKPKFFFFLSHRMKWLKVQLLPLNRMPVIIPSGFPNNLLLRVCTPWTERLLCPAQEHNTMINQVSNPHYFQGPWVSRTLTTMPQHLLITDKPFAFCKVSRQFSSTHLHSWIERGTDRTQDTERTQDTGHRTQKGHNKVSLAISWFIHSEFSG